MDTALEKKKHRLAFLQGFYKRVDGREGHRLGLMEYMELARSLSIPTEDIGEIVKYWIGEGVLLRKPASEAIGLTHKGVVAVEDSNSSEQVPLHTEFTPPRTSARAAHTGFVLQVLIASPSDVNEERDAVASAIHEWNAVHYATTGIVLLPIRWETHSFPASGDRPQAILNKQIVDDSDCVIGIFGCRLGTPSGEAQSGTIEEIERLRKAGRHVSLYFSTADVPRSADRGQLKALEDYQRERQKDTLYATFATTDELRQQVVRHLPSVVSSVFRALQASREFENLEREVRTSEARSEQGLSELRTEVQIASPKTTAPLKLHMDFTGEFPDGPRLRIRASRPLAAVQIDYLDERNVRIATDALDMNGQDFEVPLDHAKLISIHNLKPRVSAGAIPMAIRVHFRDDEETIEKDIPALMEPSFKSVNGTTTYFMKLVG